MYYHVSSVEVDFGIRVRVRVVQEFCKIFGSFSVGALTAPAILLLEPSWRNL